MNHVKRMLAVAPRPLRRGVRHLQARARWARWTVEPLDVRGGSSRGRTIHRAYIEHFLGRHADDIRGRCLEFEDDLYTTRFGTPERVDILNVEPGNPVATIVADLSTPNSIDADSFDAIVCTHVLHIVADPEAVVRGLERILAPGGVLLVATPFVCPVKPGVDERWRFTAQGLDELLRSTFDDVAVTTYGNAMAGAAILRGFTATELGARRLAFHDDRFTVEVCARVTKPWRPPDRPSAATTRNRNPEPTT